jgi:hypothetical protein
MIDPRQLSDSARSVRCGELKIRAGSDRLGCQELHRGSALSKDVAAAKERHGDDQVQNCHDEQGSVVALGPSTTSAAGAAPKGGSENVANVYWEFSTTKDDFSARVTVYYLDDEISGLREAILKLFFRCGSSGPWERVPNQTLDSDRNAATAKGVSSFCQLTLAEGSRVFLPSVLRRY